MTIGGCWSTMTSEKVLVCVIHFGGALVQNNDGSNSYTGGEAHLLDVDRNMTLDQFRSEIAEMCNSDASTLSFRYPLPTNKQTLITISNDKDLRRMVDFQHQSPEVYVLATEAPPPKVNVPKANASKANASKANASKANAPKANAPKANSAPNTNVSSRAATPKKNVSHALVPSKRKASEDPSNAVSGSAILPVSTDDSLKRPAIFGENTIIGVGQLFKDAHEFRDALRKYAIDKRFAYEFVKNDGSRVTAKCKAEGCQWRIHASKISRTKIFKIKTINGEHTCQGDSRAESYLSPTKHLVASLIKEKLRNSPDYKTKEIVNDIQRDYGLKINYMQAWRGKEFAREQLLGKDVDSLKELSQYCEKVLETNPGSRAILATVIEGQFHRLFIAFHACLHGFEQGCRPLLFLHSASLKLKHQGVLLAATSIDGDDGVFPVAFAIVEQETYDTWQWFLVELKNVLSARSLTFVSDGLKGLKEVVPEIFINSEHAFCLSYLAEKLKKEMKGSWSEAMEDALADLVYTAARARENDEFLACIESIRSILPEAAVWMMGIEPGQWANVFFKGSWYSQITSDIVECFDNWISKVDDLPVLKLVDALRRRVMELIYARRELSNQWQTRLTPKSEARLQREMDYARSLSVTVFSGTKFKVIDDHVNVVDLDICECTCRNWKLTGLPCRHVIVSLNCIGRDVYDYCERYLTADSYRLAYSEPINPILDVDIVVNSTPGITRYRMPSRPGECRPKKKRDELQPNGKRPFHCSRCKGLGHNRATCKMPI
ncbi:hypothetical protein EJ110_NYTH34016 [Nymphaea thermarum]|nr:hypothetical protein EJ110_NYTH34016 [Nymphaea thermarum]